MSDFFTVIVSYDDCVSLGMSTPHDTNPAIEPSIKVHLIDFIPMFLLLMFLFGYYLFLLGHLFGKVVLLGYRKVVLLGYHLGKVIFIVIISAKLTKILHLAVSQTPPSENFCRF